MDGIEVPRWKRNPIEREEESEMNTTVTTTNKAAPVYCVDLAKNTFEAHVFTAHGTCKERHRLNRGNFAKWFADAHRVRGVVVMEACASAHFWGRWLTARGYRVRLLPPVFVAQHRVGNKTDGNDADAIFATHGDRRVREVPVRTVAQQDACAWHRLREGLIGQRTQVLNRARGLLAERGCVTARGHTHLHRMMAELHAREDAEVSRDLLRILEFLGEQCDLIDQQLAKLDDELAAQCAQSPVAQRLDTVLGIGVVTATALAASTGGRVERYADARQFAASVGLTPNERSSGDKRRLGAITRRGDAYLRRLLVQGAQSVIRVSARRPDDALCRFAQRLRDHGKAHNTVAVAVANRMARMAYALIRHGDNYRPSGSPRHGRAQGVGMPGLQTTTAFA